MNCLYTANLYANRIMNKISTFTKHKTVRTVNIRTVSTIRLYIDAAARLRWLRVAEENTMHTMLVGHLPVCSWVTETKLKTTETQYILRH